MLYNLYVNGNMVVRDVIGNVDDARLECERLCKTISGRSAKAIDAKTGEVIASAKAID